MIVIKSNLWVKSGFDATTYGPVVFVRPGYENDRGLLDHEREHVRQWGVLAGLGTLAALPFLYYGDLHTGLSLFLIGVIGHWLLYILSPDYRLWAEIEAHRQQIYAGGITTDEAVRRICANYWLDVDPDDVRDALLGG